jgi:hypothetical protein
VADNTALNSSGGGIWDAVPTMTISNSTVAGNSAPIGSGGGIYWMNSAPTIKATIVADNTGGDCRLPVTDGGYNLDSDGSCGLSSASPFFDLPNTNPLLGLLWNNGGATETMALSPGSPAIDDVTSAPLCPATDQRGDTRTVPCDIGAYDTDANPTVAKVTPASGKVGKNVTITGTNLSGATVSFRGTPAVITTDTATEITTKVPVGATTGRITVTTSAGTVTTTKAFKVT